MPRNSCILSILSCASIAYLPPAHAQLNSEASDRLWQSFTSSYQQVSLLPLEPLVLDEKARAVLITTAGPKFQAWKADAQPTFLALLEAVNTQDPTTSKFDRIEKTLETLLPQVDPYGRYRTASEIAQWLEVKRGNPGTVHLTVVPAPDGRIFCYPLEGGPAEVAGINPGAVLLAIDGRAAEGKSLFSLGLAFAGPPHTPISLKIRQPQGKTEEFTMSRTDIPLPNVTVSQSPLGITLIIRAFDGGSAQAVKGQMETYPEPRRLTIDLRGNSGGYRDEALKIASLFFPEATHLGNYTDKTGIHAFNDGNGISINPAAIQILQDGRTASAAEFLIAALKEGFPEKVTLFGEKTYGKSHSLKPVFLEGGGELTVTEALLSTASGHSWDKSGIPADSGKN